LGSSGAGFGPLNSILDARRGWFDPCGGERIGVGGFGEVRADGILVDVGAADFELLRVADAVVGEAALPDWHLRGEAAGEATFDESDGAFEGDGFGREQEMDMVRHDNEGVESVVALFAIVLNRLDEEQGVGFDLEESATIVGRRGDEEGAGSGGVLRDRHGGWQQRIATLIACRRNSGPLAKEVCAKGALLKGTASAVPSDKFTEARL